MSQLDRLGQPFAGRWVKIWHGAETKIIGGEVVRSPPRRYRNFCLKQFWPNGCDNGDRDFVLESENVCQVALEPVRPDVRAGHRVNQLPRDATFPRRPAHSPLKDITHAKPAPDFLDIDRSAFEGEARIASDHKQPFEPRQRGDDLINHPVRKILLLGIAAHVLERQHGNRRPVRQWRDRAQPLAQCAKRSRAYGKSADRLGDVLELLFAPVLEASIQLAFDFAVHLLRNQDAARIGGPLQPERNVDPVAKNFAISRDDNLPEIDPNAYLKGAST